jgi:hypothetical protein
MQMLLLHTRQEFECGLDRLIEQVERTLRANGVRPRLRRKAKPRKLYNVAEPFSANRQTGT